MAHYLDSLRRAYASWLISMTWLQLQSTLSRTQELVNDINPEKEMPKIEWLIERNFFFNSSKKFGGTLQHTTNLSNLRNNSLLIDEIHKLYVQQFGEEQNYTVFIHQAHDPTSAKVISSQKFEAKAKSAGTLLVSTWNNFMANWEV